MEDCRYCSVLSSVLLNKTIAAAEAEDDWDLVTDLLMVNQLETRREYGRRMDEVLKGEA